MNHRRKALSSTIFAITTVSMWASSVVIPAHAGKITSDFNPALPVVIEGKATGFGGWNLTNVKVLLNPSTVEDDAEFNPESGYYLFPDGTDHSYYGAVDDGLGAVVAHVLAKDWPIGEPPGIKVINDDPYVKNGRPENCIMSTSYLEGEFLDSEDPNPVLCSGPYQSHKRFKVAMLPEILGKGGVDLVFNVEQDDDRNYQVFQKINNWTGTRLTGFTIEVGFGVGEDFTPAIDEAAENLKLSVPDDIWAENQLATFSAGLFGPLDPHGQIGFYDEKTRAGFFIDEYGTEPGNLGVQKLRATRRLGSNYEELPRGVEAMNQFGYWLPNNALPYGIFFDDDGNPETDAELVAWYGYNPSTEALGWMRGVADKFEAVDNAVIEGYGNNLLYTVGVIDDLVNVGLNYIVSVGDVTTFPEFPEESSFTIRITPTPVADGPDAQFPPYVHNVDGEWSQVTPEPWVTYNAEAAVMLQPGPVFETGQVLTARVGDSYADTTEDIDQVQVKIWENGIHAADLTLFELGEDRAVFAATLPPEYSNAEPGTEITITYGSIEDSSTAVIPQDPPVSYDVSVTEFSVPESIADGLSRTVKVRVENDHKTLVSAAGFVRLTGYVDEVPKYEGFADVPFALDPGKKALATFRWQASLDQPDVSEEVDWVAEVYIDADPDNVLVHSAAESSQVIPKVGKNSKK